MRGLNNNNNNKHRDRDRGLTDNHTGTKGEPGTAGYTQDELVQRVCVFIQD